MQITLEDKENWDKYPLSHITFFRTRVPLPNFKPAFLPTEKPFSAHFFHDTTAILLQTACLPGDKKIKRMVPLVVCQCPALTLEGFGVPGQSLEAAHT